MTVWKFPLLMETIQTVQMPEICRPLTVMVQRGIPCIWALVAENSPAVPVKVRIFGTGHSGVPPRRSDYLGSFQLDDGALVFHVFATGLKDLPEYEAVNE
jgi:hypothetical protein